MNNNTTPSASVLRLLRWFCPEALYESIEGDLREQFEIDLSVRGKGYAKRRLLWNVLRFFHPEIVLRNRFSITLINTIMIGNYVKVTWRNIQKRKVYSIINAVGLSIGIAFCMLIFLFIRDEQSFDQFHTNKNNIYRIDVHEYAYWDVNVEEKDRNDSHAYMQLGLKQVLKEEAPMVEYATRYSNSFKGIVKYDDKVFTEDLTYVDADFFNMFSFKLISGNREKLFATNSEVAITEGVAHKYFGDENPIGKTMQIDSEGEKSFLVSGIIETPPSNSSINFKILLPIENRPYYEKQLDRWGSFSTPTFVQLKAGSDLTAFNYNLEKITEKHMGDRLKNRRKEGNVPDNIDIFHYGYTALPDIHLKKEIDWEKVSDPQYSFILGGIALLILLIACINYISLALTSSASRRKEVGVRKVLGAFRKQLIFQFGFESLVLACISLIIGFGLAILFLPFFNEFTDKAIPISNENLLILLGSGVMITLLVGLLAGSYPSLVLSGFKPVLVLKNSYGTKVNTAFTKPLVVLQFALSAFLIISSVIMYKQMYFITTKNLGYNSDQVLVIPTQTGWNNEAEKVVARFRTRMQHDGDVVAVSGTSSSFNRGWSKNGYKIDGINRSAFVYAVDPYYVPLLNLELESGRNFDVNIPSDTNAVVVNEALVKDMGWTDPLNEYLNYNEDSVGPGARVIGVLKDYHYRSLEAPIDPMFLSMDKEFVGHLATMLVKVSSRNIPETIEKLTKAWIALYPDKPFDYTFMDQDVARQYESHQRWMSIVGLSTGFAILISCLGLFGLAGINAVNRTKEIGIRKVMGAELSNIFVLMNKQFIWLSIIAFIIAIPFSWYVMRQWLTKFEFRIDMDWTLLAGSILCGVVIALLTVSYHSLKAAHTNPAETLKYE
ncbi:MAG: ABC transporter permease [Cyclobacteriaceae bacterium]|nr:ABC transporter permease [Cyclobacteriaceae bacterium]